MKPVFLDTSAFLAVMMDEPEAGRIRRAMDRVERLYASNLLEAESRAALRRAGASDARLNEELAKMEWVFPDRPLTREYERLAPHGPLRGADLWHLACALFLAGDPRRLPILTLDRRQAAVAAAVGFPVRGTSAAAL